MIRVEKKIKFDLVQKLTQGLLLLKEDYSFTLETGQRKHKKVM